MSPKPPPPLNIPPGNVSVTVSAIDSTLWLSAIPTKDFYEPEIPGFGRVRCGCWSLLIEHPSGRKLLYDLGMRKDWRENLPPSIGVQAMLESGMVEEIRVEKDVAEILREGRDGVSIDVAGGEIEAVIWSHFHFDHTGDVSTFPPETKLIVGEGTKKAFMPGWPVDPKAQTAERDFEGREVVELDFSNSNCENGDCGELRIGEFRAIDYFEDGSFYILDSPGHTIGHVNALARTSVEPPEFIHLCGDSAHHCGEIRPSVYIPLPDEISPSPFPHLHDPCPSGLFSSILRKGSREDHILDLIDPYAGRYTTEGERKFSLIYDKAELQRSVRKVERFDANDNVFTVLAHDWSLKGVVNEWPRTLNGWKGKGWRKEGFWKFLGDFEEVAVTQRKRDGT